MHWTKGSTLKKKNEMERTKGWESHSSSRKRHFKQHVMQTHCRPRNHPVHPMEKGSHSPSFPPEKNHKWYAQQRPVVAITAVSTLGMASKFLAPSKGKIRRPFSPRELLVRNKSSEKESFLSTIWQHKTLQLGALWKALEKRGMMDHSPKWWKMRISTFVNFPRKFTSSTPRAQILEFWPFERISSKYTRLNHMK